eukprot:59422_1
MMISFVLINSLVYFVSASLETDIESLQKAESYANKIIKAVDGAWNGVSNHNDIDGPFWSLFADDAIVCVAECTTGLQAAYDGWSPLLQSSFVTTQQEAYVSSFNAISVQFDVATYNMYFDGTSAVTKSKANAIFDTNGKIKVWQWLWQYPYQQTEFFAKIEEFFSQKSDL